MSQNKDLFAMKLSYATATAYDGAEVSNTFFNGNIVKQEWNTQRSLSGAEGNGGVTPSGIQTYNYKYDKLNRLMDATYTGTIAEGISTTMYNATRGYDKNGNIGYLKRSTGGGATVMDELIYSYTANQLTAVADGGDATKGFKDKINTTDYGYDEAGNMITDANKDLSIQYNHLNLPASITRTNSGTNNGIIKHYYAGATKVRMETYEANGTTLVKAYDYMAGMVYITDPSKPTVEQKSLDFISSTEGRALLTHKILGTPAPPPGAGGADKFRFEYSLKDHLGNLRVSCRCGEPKRDAQGIIIPEGTPGAGIEPLAVVQEQHYDPWGLAFKPDIGQAISDNKTDRFDYNGKEKLTDLDLGWNDYGARMYMSEIGRWNGVDPLADLDFSETPYDYVDNNSLNRIDPTGCADCDGNGTDDGDCVNGGTFDDVVITAKKTVNVGVFNYIMSSINSFDPLGLENHYKYLREHGNDENWLKVKKSFVEGGDLAAGVVALPAVLIAASELGAGYLASLTLKSIGRKAAWNISGQVFNNLITGKRQLDIVGLFADTFMQFKSGGLLSGYLEAGYDFKKGEFFGESQGLIKGTLRAGVGISVGGYMENVIGTSGIGKFAEGIWEGLGKVYTESSEVVFDAIDDKKNK